MGKSDEPQRMKIDKSSFLGDGAAKQDYRQEAQTTARGEVPNGGPDKPAMVTGEAAKLQSKDSQTLLPSGQGHSLSLGNSQAYKRRNRE